MAAGQGPGALTESPWAHLFPRTTRSSRPRLLLRRMLPTPSSGAPSRLRCLAQGRVGYQRAAATPHPVASAPVAYRRTGGLRLISAAPRSPSNRQALPQRTRPVRRYAQTGSLPSPAEGFAGWGLSTSVPRGRGDAPALRAGRRDAAAGQAAVQGDRCGCRDLRGCGRGGDDGAGGWR